MRGAAVKRKYYRLVRPLISLHIYYLLPYEGPPGQVTNKRQQLMTVDLLARASMKNVASCDK